MVHPSPIHILRKLGIVNMNVRDLINIEFSYNGNLGRLQQKTIDNKIFCGRLLQSGIITHDEWRKTMKAISEYFTSEIKKVAEYPAHYIDTNGGY